jgi:hypothetical protein
VAGKTTRITFETETLLVIHRSKAISAWCPVCRAEVEVVPLDNETLAEAVTVTQFQQWLGPIKLHVWRTADGPAQICLTSLLRCFELESIQKFCGSDQGPIEESRSKQS